MIFVIDIWIYLMIMSQHPNNKETGYSNVLFSSHPISALLISHEDLVCNLWVISKGPCFETFATEDEFMFI